MILSQAQHGDTKPPITYHLTRHASYDPITGAARRHQTTYHLSPNTPCFYDPMILSQANQSHRPISHTGSRSCGGNATSATNLVQWCSQKLPTENLGILCKPLWLGLKVSTFSRSRHHFFPSCCGQHGRPACLPACRAHPHPTFV